MNYTYQVIRDCGYGKVWSRLATDQADALAEVDAWRREGRAADAAYLNHGTYSIQPIVERPNDLGGFFAEPIGEPVEVAW
jgi:hypothetical protein